MCDLNDEELEPGEAERMAVLMAMGIILADMITHPQGAAAVLGLEAGK